MLPTHTDTPLYVHRPVFALTVIAVEIPWYDVPVDRLKQAPTKRRTISNPRQVLEEELFVRWPVVTVFQRTKCPSQLATGNTPRASNPRETLYPRSDTIRCWVNRHCASIHLGRSHGIHTQATA